MDSEKLVKVSTYARENGISVQSAYDRIRDGKVKSVKIDSVIFIYDENGDKKED